ncbi:SDR family NAD(P)-dependent oxidoreductase [Haloprofundus sp. MHR1]|uniref:SDR family NAD(P)-dependent oxidoreductase n=1 Tax=Haloprofundus sp. MHR1 TaxID=2572921 RepID=UPI0010BEF37B|nr:SDR family NAD(P)-dependent oxidoreductase [Haloprofundus sp. MHR1]QCJ47476.1 SDR family NAD(P)-dependent oxidoreductase [Haloprofundus sp. MHR1]
MELPDESAAGYVALVTGGTSGLGASVSRRLADRGASVAIVGRNRERGRTVAADLRERTEGDVAFYRADLASQSAVRKLAAEFRARNDRLDLLVNGAGVFSSSRELTTDGIERTFAVNHLAPFLLTHELLSLLRAAAPSRVVTVSSGLLERGELDFSDLFSGGGYDGMDAYARSKLANVLFTEELAERLGERDGPDDAGVTAAAVNPGFVPSTNLARGASLRGRLLLTAFSRLPLGFTRSLDEGTESILAAADATGPAGRGGVYVDAAEVRPASSVGDETTRRRLWDVSAGLVGVSPDGW